MQALPSQHSELLVFLVPNIMHYARSAKLVGFFFCKFILFHQSRGKRKEISIHSINIKNYFPMPHSYIIFQAIQEENMNLEGTNIILRLVRFEQTHTIPALVIKLHCLQMNIKLKE